MEDLVILEGCCVCALKEICGRNGPGAGTTLNYDAFGILQVVANSLQGRFGIGGKPSDLRDIF